MTHRVTTREDRVRLGAFVGIVVVAFLFGFVRPSAGDRTFAANLADSLGFAALALLVLQLVVPARPRVTAAAFRPTLLVRLHGRIGYLALAAAVAHVLLLGIDDVDNLRLLNPADAPARARAALIALLALALLALAATRRRKGRQTRAWRRVHVVLGCVATAFALGHVAGVGGYLGLDAVSGTTVALVALTALVLVYFWHEHERPSR